MPPDLMSFISESITELVNNYTTVCFEALTAVFLVGLIRSVSKYPYNNVLKFVISIALTAFFVLWVKVVSFLLFLWHHYLDLHPL